LSLKPKAERAPAPLHAAVIGQPSSVIDHRSSVIENTANRQPRIRGTGRQPRIRGTGRQLPTVLGDSRNKD